MGCPICPAAGWVGGWIGGYFGIHPPQDKKGKILSAVITATLISITVIALKVFFNISFCVEGKAHLENILRVVVKTVILGIAYSLGVNCLLNRYIFPSSNPTPKNVSVKQENLETCCCTHSSAETSVKDNDSSINK